MGYRFLKKDTGFLQGLEKAEECGVRRGCGAVVRSRGNKQISEIGRGPWTLGEGRVLQGREGVPGSKIYFVPVKREAGFPHL